MSNKIMGYDYSGRKIFVAEKNNTEIITVAEFIQKYRYDIGENINNEDIKRICERIGKLNISEISPHILEKFHRQIQVETKLSFSAREHLHRVICEIFKTAVSLGYLSINPAFRTFRYEKKIVGDVKKVDVSEIKTLVKCLEQELPNHKLYYSLIIATGLKRTEIVNLRWEDVNLRKRQIKGISLSKNIIAQLNTMKKDDGYIFTGVYGDVMCPSSFTYRLNLIRKKHGLKGINMHKIYNTVNEMLKIMSHKEMQRKVGLVTATAEFGVKITQDFLNQTRQEEGE